MLPNVTTALHIYVSLPESLASGDCTFKVLKQVKNYYRSIVIQDGLNGFATPNINCGLAQKIYFFSIINAVSDKKARKSFVE
jgi:hypothetical protein